MPFVGAKEIEKIETDLRQVIKSKLLDGFHNRKMQVVVKIDSIIIDYKIDPEKSNRDSILINPLKATAYVWVNLKNNTGETNDSLQLQTNSIQFFFNEESKQYEIMNSHKIELIDFSS
ncbi:hypothetical protein GKZ90_0017790 [Flavobacterium sp. MC2016-06]|jgi:hypothetical protein|uniref:hypothetical protein n=1 Tax=Flavobacterium sp. MC2016-06 TaxID=2676308 RepID=UPI0012BAA2CD|nr:hypothetical protein [Flavobacterium sp. MC2016-06]MBU3860423.1 hypothetical protein [Flavobacterium sp. MC2016-06]